MNKFQKAPISCFLTQTFSRNRQSKLKEGVTSTLCCLNSQAIRENEYGDSLLNGYINRKFMSCWFQNSSSCGRYTRWQKSECVSICGVTWSWWEDLFWWEYMCACTCVFAAGWWRTVLLAYWTAWTTFKMKPLIARTLEPTCCLQLLVARTSVFLLVFK